MAACARERPVAPAPARLTFFSCAGDADIKCLASDLLLSFFRPVFPTRDALLERELLFHRRFEIVHAGNFDLDGNAVFAGDDLLIDVGPAAAVVEFKMDLQAAIRIASGALKTGFVAGQSKRVAGGLAAFSGLAAGRLGHAASAIEHREEKKTQLFHETSSVQHRRRHYWVTRFRRAAV